MKELIPESELIINSDGSIVAIGARLNDGNGTNSGHVRIYKYISYKAAALTS